MFKNPDNRGERKNPEGKSEQVSSILETEGHAWNIEGVTKRRRGGSEGLVSLSTCYHLDSPEKIASAEDWLDLVGLWTHLLGLS